MTRATRGRPRAEASRGARSRPSGDAGRITSGTGCTRGASRAAREAGRNPSPVSAHQTRPAPTRARAPASDPDPTTMAVPPASATASSAPTGSRPSRTITMATASGSVPAAPRVSTDPPVSSAHPLSARTTHRAHSATATRWPSITAAWARRGARQSPTRWTAVDRSLRICHKPSSGSWCTAQTTQSQDRC